MDIMTYAAAVAYTNKKTAGGGSGGTTDYNALTNKPQINGVELAGNQTAQDLKINYVVDLGEVTSGQQVTITEEQMQSFLSNNPPDVKMTLDGREIYIKRFAKTETDAYFSGSAISSSVIYSVTMSASGTSVIVNAQISQQLPETSLENSGKVPAVNKTGDGYELVTISGSGGGAKEPVVLLDVTLDEEVNVVKSDVIALDAFLQLLKDHPIIIFSAKLIATADSGVSSDGTLNAGFYGENWYQYYFKAFGVTGAANSVPKFGGKNGLAQSTVTTAGNVVLLSFDHTTSTFGQRSSMITSINTDDIPSSFTARFSTTTKFGVGSEFKVIAV